MKHRLRIGRIESRIEPSAKSKDGFIRVNQIEHSVYLGQLNIRKPDTEKIDKKYRNEK